MCSIPTDRPVAVDAETWGDGTTRCVGVGWQERGGVCVRVIWPEDLQRERRNGMHWIGHSANADRRWIGERPGLERWDDTMLMAHLLDENQSMSLKWLAGHYLGWKDWSVDIQDRLKSDKKRDAIPDDELFAYCAKDVEATVRLYSRLATLLSHNPRLRNIYHHVSRPLQDALFRTAEQTGWPLDVGRARELYERYEEIEMDYSKSKRGRKIKHMRGRGKWAEQIDELELKLDDLAGRHVNWRSPEQVRDVLYRQFEIKVEKQTEEGEDSTDVEALMAVRDQHPIVRVILSHR